MIPITIRIKTPDDPGDATVQELKSLVLAQFPVKNAMESDTRDVRLIYAGKLLAPPQAKICGASPSSQSSFNLKDGAVVHAIIRREQTPIPNVEASNGISSSESRGFDLLRNPSLILSNFPEMLPAHLQASARSGNLTSLPTGGLQQSEVDNIRAYFLPEVRLFHSMGSWSTPTCEQEQHWMRQQVRDPQAEFTVNVWQPLFGSDLTSLEAAPASTSSTPGTASFPDMSASSSSEDSATSSSEERTGSTKEFCCGLAMGYFLGTLMILCMWDRQFSTNQRTGIVCGFMLRVMVAFFSSPALSSKGSSTSSSSQGYTSSAGTNPVNAVAPVTLG